MALSVLLISPLNRDGGSQQSEVRPFHKDDLPDLGTISYTFAVMRHKAVLVEVQHREILLVGPLIKNPFSQAYYHNEILHWYNKTVGKEEQIENTHVRGGSYFDLRISHLGNGDPARWEAHMHDKSGDFGAYTGNLYELADAVAQSLGIHARIDRDADTAFIGSP